jgi:phycobilisome protein
MNTRMSKLLTSADGRYFTAEERQGVLAFAESLPRRFHAADQVEQKEEAILRDVVGEVQKRHADLAKYHDQAWARVYRDAQLVLRADVQAMVCDDVRQLDDRMLLWMRTMFAANSFTPAFVRDCFSLLRDRARGHLAAEDFDLLRPYLDRNVEVLADFPEPAARAV